MAALDLTPERAPEVPRKLGSILPQPGRKEVQEKAASWGILTAPSTIITPQVQVGLPPRGLECSCPEVCTGPLSLCQMTPRTFPKTLKQPGQPGRDGVVDRGYALKRPARVEAEGRGRGEIGRLFPITVAKKRLPWQKAKARLKGSRGSPLPPRLPVGAACRRGTKLDIHMGFRARGKGEWDLYYVTTWKKNMQHRPVPSWKIKNSDRPLTCSGDL